MAVNDYEETLDQVAAPAGQPAAQSANPYADTLKELDGGAQAGLRKSFTDAAPVAPDRAAEVRRLSLKLGVPPVVVDRNFDDYKKRDAVDLPVAQIHQETPHTAAWLQDPNNAAIGKDDLEQLGNIEWLFTAPQRAFAQGAASVQAAKLKTKLALNGTLTQEEHDLLDASTYQAQQGGALGADHSWFRKAVTGAASFLPVAAAVTKYGVAGALETGLAGAGVGSVVPGPGTIAGAITGASYGFGAGMMYGGAKIGFQLSAGQAHEEYSKLTDDVGRPLDPNVVKAAAIATGIINAGLMTIPVENVLGAPIEKLTASMTRNAVAQALKSPSIRGALLDAVKSYGGSIASTTATMIGMRAVTILGGELAKGAGAGQNANGQTASGNVDLYKQPTVKNPDGSVSTVDSFSVNIDGKEILLPTVTPDGRHLSQADALVEYQKTGRNLGTFDSPASATAFAKKLHEDYAAGKYASKYRSAGDIFGDLLREGINAAEQFALVSAAGPVMQLARARGEAVHAQAAADYFTAIGQGVTESKAAKRSPAAVQDLVERATKDGPIPAVYAPVDTWETYWQGKGIDPAAMAKEVTGDPDAYANAERTGGDLKIPTARYATTIAPTEHNAFFAQELRLGPDEMNAREGKAFVEAQQQAAEQAAQAELTPREQIRQQITERLAKAGVMGSTADSYADLIESGVGTMAEHAGMDPAEVYSSYGLQVLRPDVQEALGATGVGEATGVAGEAAASTGGQAAPEAGALPLEFGPGAYAGPERRAEAGGGPAGVERRQEPFPTGSTPEGVREAAKAMRAENPQIDQQAAEMRTRAASVERPSRPRSYAGTISGVDRKLEAAQADLRDAAAKEGRAGAGEEGRSAVRSIAPSTPVAGEREPAAARAARRVEHFEQLHTAVVDAAKRLDPNVDEPALRAEVDSRVELLGDLDRDYADSGSNPRTLLKAIADAGGLSLKAEAGGYEGELKWARESAHHGPFGAFGGVRGVFRTRKGERGLATTGLSLDDMARMLSQDFPDIQTPNDVLALLEDVARFGAEKTKTDVFPGTAALGIDLSRAWWKGADEDADISFNVSEFGQGLFDAANQALAAGSPDEKIDTLDTGEQQARLPGAGNVREQNVQTPEFDAPFSLTPPPERAGRVSRTEPAMSPTYATALERSREASQAFTEATRAYRAKEIDDATFLDAKKANDDAQAAFDAAFTQEQSRENRTTLFQGSGGTLSLKDLDEFAARIKTELPGLDELELRLDLGGNIHLDTLAAAKDAPAGTGTKAMEALTKFADEQGRGLTLSLPEPGFQPVEGGKATTSRARLVKFYKRFGFVENKGNNKNYALSIYASMYRDPEPHVAAVTRSEPFRRWFGESKVVDESTGAPLVVYHGTQRLDRFGPELRKSRATSGPMPFFTADKTIASNYATSKADTSLANEDVHGYESYFRLAPAGKGAAVNLDRAWYQLTPAEQARVAELAPRVMTNDEGNIMLGPEGHDSGTGGYDQHIKEARGNHFKALIEEWLNSGNLFNDERAFEQVLKLAGAPVDRIEFHDPYADRGGVAPVYLSIKNPLDASAISDEDVAALDAAAARQRKRPNQAGADFWDKTLRDPREWVAQLKEDQAKGVNSFVWSSIPDWVTKTLEARGYDGIHDTGGKMGGPEHDVWIPFEPQQVKSAIGNAGTFDPKSRNILKQEQRGSISFGPDRKFTINLFAQADLSTFLHETGHFFLEVFGDLTDRVAQLDPSTLSDSQRRMLGDYGAVLKELGVDNRHELTTEHHEQFARQFESYLFEGKAPNLELASAFSRFRAWLLGVYRSLTNLKAPLTDEVRGVFDRMLASDQSIAAAESRGHLEPMFTTAVSAGMSEPEFALYRSAVAKASQTAREQLDAKLLGEVRREQEASWNAQRADVRGKVAERLAADPVYQALAAIRKGTRPDGAPLVEGLETPPMQLSRAIVLDRFGADRVKELPRGILAREGGLDPDVVAEHFGFTSGDDMLTKLAASPSYRDAVEQETNRLMVQQHGSLLLDGTLPEKAQGAAANADRDAIVTAELRALSKLRRTVAPFVAAAKAQGKEALAGAGKERAYERRWLEAEAKLRIAIAEGHKQVEIDKLADQVRELKARASGGAATIRGAVPPASAFKDVATRQIGQTRIRELQPAAFWSASRRAAQQAIEKAARQDFDGAIQAKTSELLNLNLYREAEKAKDDVDARLSQMRDVARPSTRASLGLAGDAYLDQVDGILDRYEFSRVSEKVLARRANIRKFVEGLESQGLPVNLPAEVLDDARRINYREISYDELVGVTDGVAQILHLARLKNKLLTAIDKRDFRDTADTIIASINANGTARPQQLEILPKDKLARNVDGWFAAHSKLATFVSYLDGGKAGGPFWEAFLRPLNEAGTRQASMHEAAAERMTKILTDAYSGRELAKIHDRLFIPEIGASLSKEARLAVALNWGNEGNRQRLMESARRWNTSQVQAILDTLDDRDLKFVQESLDYINSFRDEIGAKEKRVTGLEPEWVEPASWNHSTYGEQKGGYYPIVYDGRLSLKQGNIIDADQANLQQHANYAYATTKRGYLESREARVNAPVRLELSAMYEHVEQVIHDLSHHEMLIDVGRLMADRGIQQAILSRRGDITYKQMRGALLDIALGTRHATTIFDRATNFVRSGATIAGIAWNPMVALHHLSGLFNGAAEIGPAWEARGAMRVFRDASSMESSARWVNEKSEMMRLRNSTLDHDVNDLRTTLARAGGWFDDLLRTVTNDHVERDDIVRSYSALLGGAIKLASLPTWIGGYEKALHAGETEARAIALADQGVLDAHGSGQLKDLAEVQRGAPMAKLFTTFYTYGNLTFNQTARVFGRTNFRQVGSVGQMLVNLSLIYALPAAFAVSLNQAFGRNQKGESVIGLFGREMLATAMNTMVGVRELGGAAQMAYAAATGVQPAAGNRGYEGPTGLRLVVQLKHLVQQAHKAAKDGVAESKLVRSVEDVAGVILHLPIAQVQRSIDGFVALQEGKTHNPAALLVGAPKEK